MGKLIRHCGICNGERVKLYKPRTKVWLNTSEKDGRTENIKENRLKKSKHVFISLKLVSKFFLKAIQ